MELFLQILGSVFLVLICVVGFFGWRLYRAAKAQSYSDLDIALSILLDPETELEPCSQKEWIDKDRLAFSESELKKNWGKAHRLF